MSMKKCQKTIAAMLLVAASGTAAAVGLGFLAETPMAYLNKYDSPALTKAATQVLDEQKDGETTQWSNEGLRNSVRIHADITASETEKTDSLLCRTLQLALKAKGQDQTLKLKLCKSGSQAWKVAKT